VEMGTSAAPCGDRDCETKPGPIDGNRRMLLVDSSLSGIASAWRRCRDPELSNIPRSPYHQREPDERRPVDGLFPRHALHLPWVMMGAH
jgi:hypothetical protein